MRKAQTNHNEIHIIEALKYRKHKKISETYVRYLWGKIAGYDDIPEVFRNWKLNLDKIENYEKVLEYLAAEYKKDSVFWRIAVKESLRYAVNFWDENKLTKCYNEADIYMYTPPMPSVFASSREFCIYVWNYLFPNEPYIIEDKSGYIDLGLLDLWRVNEPELF